MASPLLSNQRPGPLLGLGLHSALASFWGCCLLRALSSAWILPMLACRLACSAPGSSALPFTLRYAPGCKGLTVTGVPSPSSLCDLLSPSLPPGNHHPWPGCLVSP